MYTSYMNWVAIGIVIGVVFFIFLALYFWSSGAVSIADEEKEEIDQKPEAQIAKELEEVEREEKEAIKAEEDEFYSHG